MPRLTGARLGAKGMENQLRVHVHSTVGVGVGVGGTREEKRRDRGLNDESCPPIHASKIALTQQ